MGDNESGYTGTDNHYTREKFYSERDEHCEDWDWSKDGPTSWEDLRRRNQEELPQKPSEGLTWAMQDCSSNLDFNHQSSFEKEPDFGTTNTHQSLDPGYDQGRGTSDWDQTDGHSSYYPSDQNRGAGESSAKYNDPGDLRRTLKLKASLQRLQKQNPSSSRSHGSSEAQRRGKNYLKNKRRKLRLRQMKKGLVVNEPSFLDESKPDSIIYGRNEIKKQWSCNGATLTTYQPKVPDKSDRPKQPRKSRVGDGKPAQTSQAQKEKVVHDKLFVTRKDRERAKKADLKEINVAINSALLKSNPGFLVRIERTFVQYGKIVLLCLDSKTLYWAMQIINDIQPSPNNNLGYEAKGTKDVFPSECFKVYIPFSNGFTMEELLTLVDQCNPELDSKDFEICNATESREGICYLLAVKEPSLQGLKRLDCNPYAGCKRVQFRFSKNHTANLQASNVKAR